MENEIFALCEEIEMQLPLLDTKDRASVMRLYLVCQNLWDKTIQVENDYLEAAAKSMFNYIQGTGISGKLRIAVINHHLQAIFDLKNKEKAHGADPSALIEELNHSIAQRM